MDINELESFNLGDAVRFNKDLNPKIWDARQHMRPEVRARLLDIAQDFQDFLGLSDLQVKDITVSGSNAAYTYTDHSDIDLHLVVDLPEGYSNEVYRELFDAKKYQYNDQYDFRIGGYDVELYVQDSQQPHVSRGIYSVKDDDWIKIPAKRKPDVDDVSVQSKYQDVAARIDAAIKSGDLARMDAVSAKVGDMRRAGLASTGEFGPENLAFKVLRGNGTLDRLKQARVQAKSEQMSLAERQRLMREQQAQKTTQRYQTLQSAIEQYAKECCHKLELENPPRMIYRRDPAWSRRHGTFGRFDPEQHTIELSLADRHPMDIMRTLAHELAHARQHEISALPGNAGETGSPWEDEAHAVAGRLMRGLAKKHPELYGDLDINEGWRERAAGVTAAACIAGTPGCATTQGATVGDVLRGVQTVGRAANTIKQTGVAGARELAIQRAKDELRRQQGQVVPEDYDADHPPGPETPPTMPAGTVRVDVSDVYDWYKLGQHVSNLQGLGHHDFGKGPPSTIMSFGDEDTEHEYIQNLKKTGLDVTDIDPRDPKQPPGMKKIKTDPTYNVNETFDRPYKLRWERGDHGDIDAYAKLDDGNYLSIMFTKERNQDNEEAWVVEFYRNNSQEVTGEGDAMRVFATVLSAIQTFIKKYQPPKLTFSASKEVDPGQNVQSRSKLYDSLIQRYARAWGYRAFRADAGNKVIYELSRRQSVSEATGYIPVNDREARDPRYSMAITQDIRPGEVQRQAAKMGFKTDAAGVPPLLMKLQNQLKEIKAK